MHSRSWSRRVAAATSIVLASAVQANSYTIVDLGKRIAPAQINNKGNIAGQDADVQGEAAVVYRGGRWHRLAPRGVYGFSLASVAHVDIPIPRTEAPTPRPHRSRPRLKTLTSEFLRDRERIR